MGDKKGMRLACFVGFVVWTAGARLAAAQPHPDPAARALQLFKIGVEQQRAGQNRQAVASLTNAMNTRALRGADAGRAVFDRGVAYDALGNTKAAIADYSAALHLDPSLSAAHNNRGNAYRRTGQIENAKRDYLAALNCPGVVRQYPYYGMGLIAAQQGDRAGARAYFQKALTADPAFALAAQGLAALNRAGPNPTAANQAPRPPTPPHAVAEVKLRPAISDAGVEAVMIQLGAFRDEGTAKAGWSKAVAVTGGALAGLKPVIVTVDLPGKGRFWRLRTALPGKATARALCRHLVEMGQCCILAPN